MGHLPEQGPRFTRRQFLAGTGIIAGASIAKKLEPFRKVLAQEPLYSERESINPWEKKKKSTLEEKLGRSQTPDGLVYWKGIPPLELLENNEVTWNDLQENRAQLEVMNVKLSQEAIPFQFKCTFRTLLNLSVARYQEIIQDPYLIVLDPDVKEVEELVSQASEITGLPKEVIKTLAWRENGLKGTSPELHGDHYIPPKGQGFINAEFYPPHFGENIQLLDTFTEPKDPSYHSWLILVKMPGRPNGYLLPISREVVNSDCYLGTIIPLAIFLEHLEKFFTRSYNSPKIDQTIKFFLNYEPADDNLYNEPLDRLAKFSGFGFMLYHWGIYSSQEPLFTTIDKCVFDKLPPEGFPDDFAPYLQAVTTFQLRPWRNSNYILEGDNEARGHQFYCQMIKSIRSQYDFFLLKGTGKTVSQQEENQISPCPVNPFK